MFHLFNRQMFAHLCRIVNAEVNRISQIRNIQFVVKYIWRCYCRSDTPQRQSFLVHNVHNTEGIVIPTFCIYCEESRDGRAKVKMADLITNNSRLVPSCVKFFFNYANKKKCYNRVHVVAYSNDRLIRNSLPVSWGNDNKERCKCTLQCCQ
jgi:hypothetical protein